MYIEIRGAWLVYVTPLPLRVTGRWSLVQEVGSRTAAAALKLHLPPLSQKCKKKWLIFRRLHHLHLQDGLQHVHQSVCPSVCLSTDLQLVKQSMEYYLKVPPHVSLSMRLVHPSSVSTCSRVLRSGFAFRPPGSPKPKPSAKTDFLYFSTRSFFGVWFLVQSEGKY